MKDWQSPLELATDQRSLEETVFAFFGVMFWEIFQTSGIEWGYLTRKRKRTWSLVLPYLFARYCTMLSLIGLVVLTSAMEKINCGVLNHFVYWAENTAIACSSTLLALKAITIWKRNITIMVLLALICVAQWVILYYCIVISKSSWDDTGNECVMDSSNTTLIKVSHILVLASDLVSFVFATVGICRNYEGDSLLDAFREERLALWVIPALVNVFPVAFSLANLNIVMNIITVAPASVLSTIAACRLTISTDDEEDDRAVKPSMPANGGFVASRVVANRAGSGSPRRYSVTPGLGRTRPAEVRVVTDNITMHGKDEPDDFLDSPTTDNSSSVRDEDIKINVIEEVVRTTSEPSAV